MYARYNGPMQAGSTHMDGQMAPEFDPLGILYSSMCDPGWKCLAGVVPGSSRVPLLVEGARYCSN
jgi:hypothetical protein